MSNPDSIFLTLACLCNKKLKAVDFFPKRHFHLGWEGFNFKFVCENIENESNVESVLSKEEREP